MQLVRAHQGDLRRGGLPIQRAAWHTHALDNTELDLAEQRVRAASILLSGRGTRIEDGSGFDPMTYRSADPALAADIADALSNAFLPVDAERVAGATGDTRAELE